MTPTAVFTLPMLLLLEFWSDRTTHNLGLGLQLLLPHSELEQDACRDKSTFHLNRAWAKICSNNLPMTV